MSALDIESFLVEIDPDSPCGEDFEYDAEFVALSKDIEGTPEQQIGATFEPAQPPNWRDIRKSILGLLQRTHDLRLLQFLTRTLVATEGFHGLQEALLVLQKSLELFWATIHPQLDPDDDNDPTQRINILMGLCDFDTVLRPLTLAPLVESRALGRFSLRDIQFATGKLPPPADTTPPEITSIKGAFTDADTDALAATGAALNDCLESLNAIEAFVTDQVGVSNAPNFEELRNLLRDARGSFFEYAPQLAGDDEDSVEDVVAEGGNSSQTNPGGSGKVALAAINSRQDVIKALDLICAYYAMHEPSSPVPLLLQRSRRLVSMNFMEIMADLAPDGLSQVEVIRGQDSVSEDD